MQHEGWSYWDFLLKEHECPELKSVLRDLCWKLEECVGSRDVEVSKYFIEVTLVEPPEVVFSRSTMIKAKFPKVAIKISLTHAGKEHVIVDSDYLIVIKGN